MLWRRPVGDRMNNFPPAALTFFMSSKIFLPGSRITAPILSLDFGMFGILFFCHFGHNPTDSFRLRCVLHAYFVAFSPLIEFLAIFGIPIFPLAVVVNFETEHVAANFRLK